VKAHELSEIASRHQAGAGVKQVMNYGERVVPNSTYRDAFRGESAYITPRAAAGLSEANKMKRETGRATNKIGNNHKAGLGARDAFNHETERDSSNPTHRTRIPQPTRLPLAPRSASGANSKQSLATRTASSPAASTPSKIPTRRAAAQNAPQVGRVPGLNRHQENSNYY
jgi:hypothetical protein